MWCSYENVLLETAPKTHRGHYEKRTRRLAGPSSFLCGCYLRPYLFLNFSTRPPALMNFCWPVKNGWHSEQTSSLSSGLVDIVINVLPHAQVTLHSTYLGWIPSFMLIPSFFTGGPSVVPLCRKPRYDLHPYRGDIYAASRSSLRCLIYLPPIGFDMPPGAT